MTQCETILKVEVNLRFNWLLIFKVLSKMEGAELALEKQVGNDCMFSM